MVMSIKNISHLFAFEAKFCEFDHKHVVKIHNRPTRYHFTEASLILYEPAKL